MTSGSATGHRQSKTYSCGVRDAQIRHALLDRLAAEHRGDASTRVWPEMSLCLGAARVDIGVVNGSLTGFEIKSAADRLTRLPRQLELYQRCLDYVTIVVEERWATGAAEVVPESWGIVIASETSGNVALEVQRAAERNVAVDPLSIAQLLWRDEAAAVVKERGIASAVSRLTRWDLWDLLVEHLTIGELGQIVRDQLRARPARQET